MKSEGEVAKTVTRQCEEMQAVTTLCRFPEVCTVPNGVAVVYYRVLLARVDGATSGEGFLVQFVM